MFTILKLFAGFISLAILFALLRVAIVVQGIL